MPRTHTSWIANHVPFTHETHSYDSDPASLSLPLRNRVTQSRVFVFSTLANSAYPRTHTTNPNVTHVGPSISYVLAKQYANDLDRITHQDMPAHIANFSCNTLAVHRRRQTSSLSIPAPVPPQHTRSMTIMLLLVSSFQTLRTPVPPPRSFACV